MLSPTDHENTARDLLVEAEKKLSATSGFLRALFGDWSRFDCAMELFRRAGVHFALAGNHNEGSKAFRKSAKLQLAYGSKHEAASNYVSASNCLRKFDVRKAMVCLKKAVDLYVDLGRYSMAAKYEELVAELCEELGDLETAMEHYNEAADYFFGEGSKLSGDKCLLKIALYTAENGSYEKAINLLDRIILDCLDGKILKDSLYDYFFRATLCHLCIDVTNAQRALQRYVKLYPAFEDTVEFNVLKKLIESVDYHEIDLFTQTVKTFDAISRLDQWTTNILLRIKKEICFTPKIR